jgi:hypothetical protein
MNQQTSVPDDFVVPQGLRGDGFRLEPLGEQHNESDHEAWTSSIAHIRATPGFQDRAWPPVDGMSREENLRDLRRHADDFARRFGFTYTVLDDDDRVVGCVYIYPLRSDPGVMGVRSWVRADRQDLDGPLYSAVRNWLVTSWPFERIMYRDLQS